MTSTETHTLSNGHNCDDCRAEAEIVRASYRMCDGVYVCDSHLDIRLEGVR